MCAIQAIHIRYSLNMGWPDSLDRSFKFVKKSQASARMVGSIQVKRVQIWGWFITNMGYVVLQGKLNNNEPTIIWGWFIPLVYSFIVILEVVYYWLCMAFPHYSL